MLKFIYFRLFPLLIIISYATLSFSQEDNSKSANNYFSKGNFQEALKLYLQLSKASPSNQSYNKKIGQCYLQSNIDKTAAIPYLEKASQQEKVEKTTYFELGLAYQYNLEFDKAVQQFNKFKEGAFKGDIEIAEWQIAACGIGDELVKHPVDVTFTNMGANINTAYPDYYPFITKGEDVLIYTSRRKENVGGELEYDGYYTSDVLISKKVEGNFKKARNIGSLINSQFDEQAVGLSNDANNLFIYQDKIKEFGDIFISDKTQRSYGKKTKLGENVNSKSMETAASISADGNTLFFASARTGGEGALDLYMTRKLPNGEWAIPQNLGSKINSEYNEDFPNLSNDGKTLYFCSQGHGSMGGYDIYKANWDSDNNAWSAPINIGYPINTPDDERVISFSKNGKNAYISAVRKGGFGNLDIYKIHFNGTGLSYGVLQVRLPKNEGDSTFVLDSEIAVYNVNGDEIGLYAANQTNGIYTIILFEGNYKMEIISDNYHLHEETFIINQYIINKGTLIRKIYLKLN